MAMSVNLHLRWLAFPAGALTLVLALGSASDIAFAKKDGNEVRQESGSSGKGSGSDDRQVRDDASGRDDGASNSGSGQGSGNSGRGGGNSGSTRNGGLDEVASKLDSSAGVPSDGSRASGAAASAQRVRIRDDDRL
jgi:hypothetical protein